MKNSALIRYFLGAHTPLGFYSYFSYLIDLHGANNVYIIKGAPGTGKSTFLKTIAEEASENGHFVEYIHCSGDPYSLDGIYIPSLKVACVDGTTPHVIDPVYPSVVDKVINMGDFLKENEIGKRRKEVIDLTDGLKDYYNTAYLYIRAAREAQLDIFNVAAKHILSTKMSKHISGMCKEALLTHPTKKAVLRKRFISAISNTGIISFTNNLSANYENVYMLDDEYGIASIYLAEIVDLLSISGYDLDIYYSPLGPTTDIEALAIPEIDTVFLTSSGIIPYDGQFKKRINLLRFVDTPTLKPYKHRFRFDNKLISELLKAAIEQLNKAQEKRDELETFYRSNMDFCGIDKLASKVAKEILQKTK